jgi:fumarate hydratase class II
MATVSEQKLRSLPIGTGATGTRVESDSMGEVKVPADHYWGRTDRAIADSFLDRR